MRATRACYKHLLWISQMAENLYREKKVHTLLFFLELLKREHACNITKFIWQLAAAGLVLSPQIIKLLNFSISKEFLLCQRNMVTYFLQYTIIFFCFSPFSLLTVVKNEGICTEKICVPRGVLEQISLGYRFNDVNDAIIQ